MHYDSLLGIWSIPLGLFCFFFPLPLHICIYVSVCILGEWNEPTLLNLLKIIALLLLRFFLMYHEKFGSGFLSNWKFHVVD